MNKLLQIAIKIKNLDLVKMHVQNGVNLEEPDVQGRSALLLAADVGASEIFEYLLYNGVNDQINDNQGRTLSEHLKAINNSEIISIYEHFLNERQESKGASTVLETNSDDECDIIDWEAEPTLSFDDDNAIQEEVMQFEGEITVFSISDQSGAKDDEVWLDEDIIKEIESNHQTRFVPELVNDDIDYLKAVLAFAQDYGTVPVELIDNLTQRFSLYGINVQSFLYDYLSNINADVDTDLPDELVESATKRFRAYLHDVDNLEFDVSEIVDALKQELVFTDNTELFSQDVSRISNEALAPLRHKSKSLLESLCQFILEAPILWKCYWEAITSQYKLCKLMPDEESEDKSDAAFQYLFRDESFIKKYKKLFKNGIKSGIAEDIEYDTKKQLLKDTVYSFRLALFFLDKFNGLFNQLEDISYQDAVISNNLYTMQEYLERLRKRIIHSQMQNTLNLAVKLYVDNDIDDLSDIIQEAMTGLIKAVDRYDFRQKAQLMTYASYWIKQMIQRKSTDSSLVKIPSYIQEEYRAQLKSSFDQVNIFIPQVYQLEIDGEKAIVTEPEMNLKYDISDMFTYTNFRLSSSEYKELELLTGQLVKSLPRRHRSIIQKRYGLGKEMPFTLEKLASVLALTRERIRQLERRSLELLREETLKHGEIIVYGDQ
ncbi:MAG: sigma-70 family RNA polymerase sigma factor [Thermoguttaceae bacterium]|nr:sigma-70 family RNA polymerase sigma factor [Thermoguttaceae bacterium]MBQ6615562.1 sigma-70 family RNA polymerase sigma factor [Thermoguttaceae bacterium]